MFFQEMGRRRFGYQMLKGMAFSFDFILELLSCMVMEVHNLNTNCSHEILT